MANVSREIHLKSRPTGMPTAANFELVETLIPRPGPGQFLVRNIWMSVDPYMRGRMMDRTSYAPPFQIGASSLSSLRSVWLNGCMKILAGQQETPR
jgi:NADPH-dependent curcumin reductase CurA